MNGFCIRVRGTQTGTPAANSGTVHKDQHELHFHVFRECGPRLLKCQLKGQFWNTALSYRITSTYQHELHVRPSSLAQLID